MTFNDKKDAICLLTKKHPSWKKMFISWITKYPEIKSCDIKLTFDLFLTYKNLLKKEITPAFISNLSFDNELSIVEKFHDVILSRINDHHRSTFIKELSTQSYSHLFNEKIEKEIIIILKNNISIKTLRSQFFHKLKRFKTSDELYQNLVDFKNKNIQWNKDYYLDLIYNKKLNAKIESLKNNKMLIHVLDYNSCKEIGSQAWCIVAEEKFFFQYVKIYTRQFIYLDFDLPIEDNLSMVGITVGYNGRIFNSYNKEDTFINIGDLANINISSIPRDIMIHSIKNSAFPKKTIIEYGLFDYFDLFFDSTINSNKNARYYFKILTSSYSKNNFISETLIKLLNFFIIYKLENKKKYRCFRLIGKAFYKLPTLILDFLNLPSKNVIEILTEDLAPNAFFNNDFKSLEVLFLFKDVIHFNRGKCALYSRHTGKTSLIYYFDKLGFFSS
jgi:hypothetical protein